MLKYGVIGLVSLLSVVSLVQAEPAPPQPDESRLEIRHSEFRNEVIRYVKSVAIANVDQTTKSTLNELERQWNNHHQPTQWQIGVQVYHQGDALPEKRAQGESLTETLAKATQQAMSGQVLANDDALQNYRFQVAFYYHPHERYSLIDAGSEGKELQGDRVIVRSVTREAIEQQITASKAYLIRTMNPDFSGFFKVYDADEDRYESLLTTTYSATALNAFIRLNEYKKDLELESYFKDIAAFLMQQQLKDGPNAGGFDYGVDPDTEQGMCRVVVGTTSNSIYTLLKLNQLYPNDENYRKAAIAAGDWLLKMVNDDGSVTPVADCQQDDWEYDQRQSFLYTGQVVSALARLYQATGNSEYLDGAKQIASLLLKEVARQGALVADEYRPANSVSSSWVMMGLIDLAKVDATPVYEKTVLQIADALVDRQIVTEYDAFNYGRYLDAMTTKDNGWINEAMGEMTLFCREQELANCEIYQHAMQRSARWLLQNAYTKDNTYHVKKPEHAIGGLITDFNTASVRTDAVSHTLNGLLILLSVSDSNDSTLLTLPERPLKEILPLLRSSRAD